MTDSLLTSEAQFLDSRPAVRSDAVVRHYATEIIAWSPEHPYPAYLEPVEALVFQMLDGSGTIREIVDDVHDVVGVPPSVAAEQIRRVVLHLDQATLLTTSRPPADADADPRGTSLGPPNP